mmetsp:Transcript_118231/g.228134  ORF Transcript_118231/g.228134 Transcript_118231/m.228134 type:complete len:525 (-) Transcript_118231:72-1646(-)
MATTNPYGLGLSLGWIEIKEGEHYCVACNKWATPEHLENAKHQWRVQGWASSEAPGLSFAAPPPQPPPLPEALMSTSHRTVRAAATALPASTDPYAVGLSLGWLEMRSGEHYCIACNRWATPEHLTNDKHVQRASYWVSPQPVSSRVSAAPSTPAGSTAPSTPAGSALEVPIDQLPDWMLVIDGEHFCTLCNKWATPSHLENSKHKSNLEAWLQQSEAPAGSTLAEPYSELRDENRWGEAQLSLPKHWTGVEADARWQGCGLCSVADDPEVMQILQGLLRTDSRKLGVGRDVMEAGNYTRLVLATAWRIENPRLWRRYAVERKNVLEELEQGCLPLPELKLRQNFYNASAQLPDCLMKEINEVRLLHGTKPETVLSLISNGLNEHFSGGMFGHGSYVAENAGKTDQYCTLDRKIGDRSLRDLHARIYRAGVDHPGDVFYLVLCRVVMGYFVRSKYGDFDASALDGDGRVYATPDLRELANIPNSPFHYHSLLVEMGGQINRYREIVQFHGARIYPEYLLAYQRK